MKFEDIKNFYDEHKAEIIVGAAYIGVFVGSAVLGTVIENRRIDRRVLKAMGKFGHEKEKGKNLKLDLMRLINGCDRMTTCKYGEGTCITPSDVLTEMGMLTAGREVLATEKLTGIILCTK